MDRVVLLFKMSSGETVVAEYLDSINDQVIVSEPIALELEQTSRGFSLMSTIWIPLYRENEPTIIEISKMHIVTQLRVDAEMEKYYDKTVAYFRGDMEQLKAMMNEDQEDNDGDHTMSMMNFDITANTVVH